jgi:hypothetical protein
MNNKYDLLCSKEKDGCPELICLWPRLSEPANAEMAVFAFGVPGFAMRSTAVQGTYSCYVNQFRFCKGLSAGLDQRHDPEAMQAEHWIMQQSQNIYFALLTKGFINPTCSLTCTASWLKIRLMR